MDRIINVMGFCHSYCRCSNDHICIQGNRNLKIRSSLIARRQIFLTVNYYSGKFLTAELDGCVCLTLLYSDTFTSDLRFPCAAFKGKSICCICTISKCKNRYYILCILFCILTVFFQTRPYPVFLLQYFLPVIRSSRANLTSHLHRSLK